MKEINEKEFTEKAWQDMLGKLDEVLPVEKKKRRLIPIWWLGIAASFILAFVIGFSYLRSDIDSLSPNPLLKAEPINNGEVPKLTKTPTLSQESHKSIASASSKPNKNNQTIELRKNLNPKNKSTILQSTKILLTTNSKINKNFPSNDQVQKIKNPSTSPTSYEIPSFTLDEMNKKHSKLILDSYSEINQTANQLIESKHSEGKTILENDIKRNLLTPIPFLKNDQSITFDNSIVIAPMFAEFGISPKSNIRKMKYSLQLGYLVIGHKSLSDIGYLNFNLEKPISDKYGFFGSIGIGKESTPFEYFKLDSYQANISTSNQYDQIEERIVGFGCVQLGIQHSISHKWNQRLGFGYKMNFSEIAGNQLSNSLNKLPQPLEALILRNQFYGQYDLGYTLISDFTLVGSFNLMSAPLVMKNNLVPKPINTYVGMGLRYQF